MLNFRNLFSFSLLIICFSSGRYCSDQNSFRPNKLSFKQNSAHDELYEAIRLNRADDVSSILDSHPTLINDIDEIGDSPILYAVMINADSSVLDALLSHGPDLKIIGASGLTAVNLVINKKRTDILKLMLQTAHDSVAVQDSNGNYPLHSAVLHNDIDMIKLLINNGADIEVVNNFRITPFQVAIEKGYYGTFDFLINKGADVNFRTGLYSTPLETAMDFERSKMAKRLIDLGAKTNIFVDAGLGHTSQLISLIVSDKKLLEERDNRFGYEGFTPLHYCSMHGHLECCEKLIELGANIKSLTDRGFSPLHFAKTPEIAELFLKKGIPVDFKGESKYTPLDGAVSQNHLDVVKILIENGADVKGKWDDIFFPLYFAVNQQNLEIVKYLLENGADTNKGGYDCPNLLFDNISLEIAKLLVEYGADINAKCHILPAYKPIEGGGWTPLHYAALMGNIDLMKFYLSSGADINARSDSGYTPLHLTALFFGVEPAEFLISKGAEIKVRTKSGQTPKDLALSRNNYKVARFLEKYD